MVVLLHNRGLQVVARKIHRHCRPASNFNCTIVEPLLLSFTSSSSSNYDHHSSINRKLHSQTVNVQIKAIYQYQNPNQHQKQQLRSYSSSTPTLQKDSSSSEEEIDSETPTRTLIYEGPFASLSQRLKRISITTAIVSIIGVPLLVASHSGDVPASGQFAVGATAIIAATGSTAALSYCFSPYVKTLSYVSTNGDCDDGTGNHTDTTKTTTLVEATTTNIFAMEKITTFNPDTDVSLPSKAKTYRPFCNFMVRGEPFYIHPNLLHDDILRVKLVGEKEGTSAKFDDDGGTSAGSSDEKKKKLKKDLDDDFL
mmetsp:Transcript_17520/g.22141  ORF Transcript_17520/g.22141 Transcript_17520/m.22141 type:complete len:311 (+) Transcript_17520:43-975(+)